MELPRTSTLQPHENEALLDKEQANNKSTTITSKAVLAISALTIAIFSFAAYTFSSKDQASYNESLTSSFSHASQLIHTASSNTG